MNVIVFVGIIDEYFFHFGLNFVPLPFLDGILVYVYFNLLDDSLENEVLYFFVLRFLKLMLKTKGFDGFQHIFVDFPF